MMKRVLLAALLIAASVCAGWYAHSAREKVKMRNLKATDPELAALWENFVGNDVRPHGSLDAKTRHLILQAGHVAAQSPNEYQLVLAAALDDGVSPVEAKEALYQTIPYVGMAKAYDFVLAANEVMAEKGIQLPLEGQSRTTPQNRLEKGLAAQKEIFGSHIDEMRASAPAELKHIQDYLSANCFGDYYTRGGLDLKTRELLTFATLISLGGVDSQVRSHVQGNLNMGNGSQVLLDTVAVLLPYIGYPRSLNAIAAVNEIAKE